MTPAGRDWRAWHAEYTDPESALSGRLRVVQRTISDVLDAIRPGSIQVVSACAGDGRDLFGVLADHRRRSDVRACLIELDAEIARAAAAGAPAGTDVRCADAGVTASYRDALPADVVLMCGVFGNISDADVRRTIEMLRSFVIPDGFVIWTRHRRAPDLTPDVRQWFLDCSFDEFCFETGPGESWSVGANRYCGSTAAVPDSVRFFTFSEPR